MSQFKKTKRAHKFIIEDHPQRKEDEILLTTSTKSTFDRINWDTKRLGEKTPDGKYPIFAKIQEIQQAGFSVN